LSIASNTVVPIAPPSVADVNLTVEYGSTNNRVGLLLTGGAATSVAVVDPSVNGSNAVTDTFITYTPTAGYAGLDSLTYKASNGSGTSLIAKVRITVNAPILNLALASTDSSATVGKAFQQSFTTTGGTGPYTYSLSDAPAGFVIDAATGALSGTPTIAGIYRFTVKTADNSTGAQAPFTASLVDSFIVAKTTSITTLVVDSATLQHGSPLVLQASVTASATGSVNFYDGSTLLGSATLTALGEAQTTIATLAVGTHSITAEYTNDANTLGSTSAVVLITVRNNAPVLGTLPTLTIASNDSLNLDLSAFTAIDVDGDSLTLLIDTAANYNVHGLEIIPATDFIGTITVPVRVTDGKDTSSVILLSITVSEPVVAPPVATIRTQDNGSSLVATSSGVCITLAQAGVFNLSVFDYAGRQVFNRLGSSQNGVSQNITFPNLQHGAYVVRVSSNSQTKSVRWIK